MKKLFALSALLLLSHIAFNQVVKYSNDFLNIGVSARAMAMGNAVYASKNYFPQPYYNPSALYFTPFKNSASAMHAEYFAGIANYNFLSYSHKLSDSAVIAVSAIRLSVDNIQNTLFLYDPNGNINYNNITYFSVADNAIFFSFANKTKIKGLIYGLNAKIIIRHQGEFANAFGFGIDAGAFYSTNKWNFAAVITDATNTFTAWFYNLNDSIIQVFNQTNNQIPENTIEITLPSLKTAVNRSFKIDSRNRLTAETDLIFFFDGKRHALISFFPVSVYPQIGLEYSLQKRLFVRAGFNNFQLIPKISYDTAVVYREKSFVFQPNFGIGVRLGRFMIDYALTNVGNLNLGLYSHIFTISAAFDKNYNTIYRKF